jgi:hypothetical protein
MKKLQFCLVFTSLLVLVLSAAAQIQNGQLAGEITDPSGAAITGAKVTIKNPATDLTTTVTAISRATLWPTSCRWVLTR